MNVNEVDGEGIESFDHSQVLGLVADVGGTHIRFGIAVGASNAGPLNVHCVRRYPVRVKCARLPWQTLLAALGGATATVSTE